MKYYRDVVPPSPPYSQNGKEKKTIEGKNCESSKQKCETRLREN